MHFQPAPAPQRAYFLDWLRIAAFGLLVIYHVGMYYVSWDWHVKSPFAGTGLEPWMLLSSPWRMALLFVVSGAATSFMLRSGAGTAFLGGRTKRLLLPLLCGVLLVVPPQSYLEVVNRLGYTGTYFEFLRLYFSGYGGFCRDAHCLILPTWNHLWFLAYLWVYTLGLWALLQWRPHLLEALLRGAETLLAGSRLLWLPIGLLALLRLTLYPRFPSTHALVDDAYNHAVYFTLFMAGVVFARAPRFWNELAARRWLALALALCGWLLLAGFARGDASASAAPEGFRALHRVVFAGVQWSALVSAIGFARHHLDVDHAWRRTLTEAVFPVYMLHQTIIIVLAQGLLPLRWVPSVEGPVLVFATFALSLAGYGVVRAVPWLRPWFGLARRAPAAFPPLARAATLGLFTLMMVGLLLGCVASPDARRLVTPMGDTDVRQGGARAPAVVFQSGLGDGAEVWRSVAPRIAAQTTVVASNRHGYGADAASAGPRDACTIATEQRSMLRVAGVQPPFVLVGHSLGGLYQYVYARLYPQDVAALVLVDATHPQHWHHLQAEAPTVAAAIKGLSVLFGATMKREFADQEQCLERVANLPPLRVPTRLLVRSRFGVAEHGAFEQMVVRLQSDWQALTGAERIERVEGAGHYIQKERPEAVVRAIEDVVRRVRSGSVASQPPGSVRSPGVG